MSTIQSPSHTNAVKMLLSPSRSSTVLRRLYSHLPFSRRFPSLSPSLKLSSIVSVRAFSNETTSHNKNGEKVVNKPPICTADELHYVTVENSDWRLALWRYCPSPKAVERKHPLLLLSGVGTNAIGYDLSPEETVIRKAQPLLKETIKGITSLDGFKKCVTIADLGCSSGPNTLLVLSNLIDGVHDVCKQNNLEVPQLQVYLNDLFENDFNSVFKSLPMFLAKYNKEKGANCGPCFISVAPGSFYGRLFPDESIHLFHSSYSLHWLSQVPKGLDNNKLNIYMARASPPNVFEMYRMQFENDFKMFLESRSSEIIHGGRMVLAFLARSNINPRSDDSSRLWELLSMSLVDMMKEGLVQESEINSFNMPIYTPHKDEVRDIIHNQGSFSLDTVETFEINWDPYDTNYANKSASYGPNQIKRIAKMVQAATEPVLASHFGNSSIPLIFEKYEKYVIEHLAIEKTKHFNIVICLTKF